VPKFVEYFIDFHGTRLRHSHFCLFFTLPAPLLYLLNFHLLGNFFFPLRVFFFNYRARWLFRSWQSLPKKRPCRWENKQTNLLYASKVSERVCDGGMDKICHGILDCAYCYRLDSNTEKPTWIHFWGYQQASLDKTRPQVSVQLPGAIACYQEIIAVHLFIFLLVFCLISLDDASTES